MDDKKPQETNNTDWIKEAIKNGAETIKDIFKNYLKAKYSYDRTGIYVHLAIVTVLAGTIIFTTWLINLDHAVTGTLLGSLIAFAFSSFPNKRKNNNDGNG